VEAKKIDLWQICGGNAFTDLRALSKLIKKEKRIDEVWRYEMFWWRGR
jgi:hypothetical protein